jgi:hypothetical protein
VFELYSVGLMLLARRKWGIDRLKLNNEVAGFKFSVIGVLYAVLLAFVVIAVWENYNATEGAIRNEGKAVGAMAQLSYALPEAQDEEMRRLLDAYVKEAQQSEWPMMAAFGTMNVVAQTLMTATLAALIALILVPAILLDFPFTGEVALSSAPFDEALQQTPPHLNEPIPPPPSRARVERLVSLAGDKNGNVTGNFGCIGSRRIGSDRPLRRVACNLPLCPGNLYSAPGS